MAAATAAVASSSVAPGTVDWERKWTILLATTQNKTKYPGQILEKLTIGNLLLGVWVHHLKGLAV